MARVDIRACPQVTAAGGFGDEGIGRLLPGQRVDVTGFNVLRIGTGPWCVLFNPSSVTVGENIVMPVDHAGFQNVAHAAEQREPAAYR